MPTGTPPPPPGRRMPGGVATAIVGVSALMALAFVAGIAVGTGRGGNERTVDTTAPAASGSTRPSESLETAPESASPGPAVPFTNAVDVVYPADVAALRAMLDTFGYPAWWPLPDAVAPRAAPLATVQELIAGHSVTDYGTTDARGSTGFTSRWLVDVADVDTAEAQFVAKVPSDRFDVPRGVEGRTVTVEDGVTEVVSVFPELNQPLYGSLYLAVEDAINPETGARVGTSIRLTYSGQPIRRPPPVPVGSAPGLQFLAQAPSATEMAWESTTFSITGQLSSSQANSEPSGVFSADWTFDAGDLDAVVPFLSDPANFSGDLQQVTIGEFRLDDYWVQPMDYQGLPGRYEISVTDPDEDLYVHLTFPLTTD